MNNNTQMLAQHYEQLLNLTNPWVVKDVELDADMMRLVISVGVPKGAKLPCSKCGTACPKQDHRHERTWRHLDTMQFKTLIKCHIPRIHCKEHGILSADVPWANDYSRFTLLFESFAIDVLKASKNVSSAMSILMLSWDQIHEIQKKAVERGLAKRQNEEIRHVGIDEKNFLKGHSYVSLLTDIDKGCVLEVVPDRTEEAAKTLLETLSDKQKEKVEATAIDMWIAFMKAVKDTLPNADIVHDKYHVATYLGKAVDAVRKKENGILTKTGDDSLKGTKYLWLTNPDNWSKDAKKEFRSLAVDELKVGRAWSIKEAFRHLWDYQYFGVAEKFFRNWYFWATHSRLKPIIEAAKTLKRHIKGILSYLKHHITNAVTEGLNSKIQSIKTNARGFRNFEHYRIAILFHCGKLEMYP